MKIQYRFSLITASTVIFISCSSTSEKTEIYKQETDSSYVFDQVPPEDFITFETPQQLPDEVYIVQIGAFSSFDGAKQFAELSRIKLNHEIKVSFNEKKKLYVVQIHPPFNSRQSALEYRDKIKINTEYEDAWIVTLPAIKD